VLLLTVLAVVLVVVANSVAALAQSQTQTPETSATPPAAAANPAQKPESTPTPATGTIKGRIVAADGQPLTNANVMAQALSATPTTKPARVDADGRFAFEDLPPSAYLLIATAPGYIDEAVSAGNASDWPRHLIGSNVRITMIRGGVITGVVTNPRGEPVVGVAVRATSTAGAPSIANFFTGGGLSETDDRGIYRIYGLKPGQYVVSAGGSGQFGTFTPSGFDSDVLTYYPSATRDTAVPVSVRSGDETSGIDIKYKGLEGHSISGVVLGNVEASTLSGAITVFLAHAGSASVLTMAIAPVTESRRAFSFNGVADGEYDLFANYLVNQNSNAMIATKRVSVRGGDVTGLELNLAPLGSILGTVILDPIKPEARCDKRSSQVIEVVPKTPRDEPKKTGSQSLISILSPGLGLMNEKGEFALRNLEPGETLSGVTVMVGQDAAGLSGRAVPEGATVREGTRVHLIPAEAEQANNILRYGESVVKRDGSFALTNIAPGRYFVLVRVEAPAETDGPARPIAWHPTARIKLRREAEAAKISVELKPCERVVDYTLKPGG
jgi:hypothetical protein